MSGVRKILSAEDFHAAIAEVPETERYAKPVEAVDNRLSAERARARSWGEQWNFAVNGGPAPTPDTNRAWLEAIAPTDKEAHERHLAHVRRLDAQAAGVGSEERPDAQR